MAHLAVQRIGFNQGQGLRYHIFQNLDKRAEAMLHCICPEQVKERLHRFPFAEALASRSCSVP